MRYFPLTLVLVAALGCDPLAAPDYPGEPMLEVSGEVDSVIANAPPTEIALAWLVNDFTFEFGFFPQATTVPVEGQFPAGFTMRLYHPPPRAAFDGPVQLNEGFNEGFGSARIAVGIILALREGAGRDLTTLREEDLLGVSDNQIVVFVEGSDDFAEGYLLATPRDDDELYAEVDACFFELSPELQACEDPCFQNDCWDPCFNVQDPGAQERCFSSCDEVVNSCLDTCQTQYESEINGCFELIPPPFEPVANDALRVRMFEDASAEEVWAQLRPEDCNEAALNHADCVLACPDLEGPCVDQCAATFAPSSCGAPAGNCELLSTLAEACFQECIDTEVQCFNACPFADTTCEDGCFQATDSCFFACDDEYFALEPELCGAPPPLVEEG